MKKELAIIIICFSIFILLLSPVSAGWFSDFWGRITGKTVSGTCEGTVTIDCSYYDVEDICPEVTGCEWIGDRASGECIERPCGDFTDQSNCQAATGCTWAETTTDDCIGGSISIPDWGTCSSVPNQLCAENLYPSCQFENNLCSNIYNLCGEVTSQSICQSITGCSWVGEITPTCTDSDGGNNIYTKGICTDNTGSYEDVCTGSEIAGLDEIDEKSCLDNNCVGNIGITCPSGYVCSDGACVGSNLTITPVCGNWILEEGEVCDEYNNLTDDDYFFLNIGGSPYLMRVSKVNIASTTTTSDIEIQEVSTGIKYLLENKDFTNGQNMTIQSHIYTFTNNTMGGANAGFRITNAGDWCSSACAVELTSSSAPAPAPARAPATTTAPTTLESGEECRSNECELNEMCYPLGYRRGTTEYCAEGGEFIEQQSAGVCANHFECRSNLCIEETCVTQSLLERIIAWFRNLFGG